MNPLTLTEFEAPLPVLQSTTGSVTSCSALAGNGDGGPELLQLLLLQEFIVTPDTGALIRPSMAVVTLFELPPLPGWGVSQLPMFTWQFAQPALMVEASPLFPPPVVVVWVLGAT
jgi:hypothetical protein